MKHRRTKVGGGRVRPGAVEASLQGYAGMEYPGGGMGGVPIPLPTTSWYGTQNVRGSKVVLARNTQQQWMDLASRTRRGRAERMLPRMGQGLVKIAQLAVQTQGWGLSLSAKWSAWSAPHQPPPQDLLHVLLKAHVQHLVCLIQDGVPHLRARRGRGRRWGMSAEVP